MKAFHFLCLPSKIQQFCRVNDVENMWCEKCSRPSIQKHQFVTGSIISIQWSVTKMFCFKLCQLKSWWWLNYLFGWEQSSGITSRGQNNLETKYTSYRPVINHYICQHCSYYCSCPSLTITMLLWLIQQMTPSWQKNI